MTSILAEFFRQNVWANLRLIDACGEAGEGSLAASAPGTFGDVYATLIHIVSAEEGYLIRLTGGTPDGRRDGEPLPDLAELRERARRCGEGLIEVAEQIRNDKILRGTWRGQPYAIPTSTFLIQAINHGTDHRSEVCTIMTQQGIVPPGLDGWTFQAERADEA